MTTTKTDTKAEFTPAKRGDIAVAETVHSGYSLTTGRYTYREYVVGIVTSVTRDGEVKRIDPECSAGAMTPRDWQAMTILPAGKLRNTAGFLAECRKRQSTDPDTYAPFETLNDVRETARKYL